MDSFFLPLLIGLLVLAALLRDDFIFSLIYLFTGAYALGRWWNYRAIASLRVSRTLASKAFIDEEISVTLEISNRGILPVVWVRLHDSLPIELSTPNFFRQVIRLGPYERVQFEYTLYTRKRGYYTIGPLSVQSSDILGLNNLSKRDSLCNYLTVFPKIIPLSNINLPSRSPLGTIRHYQPIFEDPSRVLGKRDYMAGDSLRQVDWKTTAVVGRLQIKQFEPSISIESCIFLNLNNQEYDSKTRYAITELAIVVAASISNWIISKRQSVGLIANGIDPLSETGKPQSLPAHKGRSHLLRILEVLARLQSGEIDPLVTLIRQSSPQLSWGTTLIIITGQVDKKIFDTLSQACRRGQMIVLVLCGPVRDIQEIQSKVKYYGFPLYHLMNEQDMDIWR
jgi:uncharacterized protein (DUF58 family)